MMHSRIWILVGFLAAAGCGAPEVPGGVDCKTELGAGKDAAGLKDALKDASGSDCVVLEEATYKGSFTVPAGVTLVTGKDESAVVTGSSADDPAIIVEEGAALWGVEVKDAPGHAIFVRAGSATLTDVVVDGAGDTGIAIVCSDATCLDTNQEVRLVNVSVTKANTGLWCQGARVIIEGGTISENQGQSLTAGAGLIAMGGAQLSMSETTVADNDYGVLIDGGDETTGDLEDLQVLENRERGLWAQRLRGTTTAPALSVTGEHTLFDSNAHTGIGAVDSVGIIVVNGRVIDTIAKPAVVDIGGTASIGDGIGLFGGSGQARIDNVEMQNNERSQMLVDQGTVGIIVVNGRVTEGEGLHKIVVQNTTAEVEIPSELISTGVPELDVSAPLYSVDGGP